MSIRRSYPSDISNARWQFISPLVRSESLRGRKRSTELREVVNAINYRWTTGCPWRMLPHDFPPWETVYTYFDRWRNDGTLRQIREVILRRSPYISESTARHRMNPHQKASPQSENIQACSRMQHDCWESPQGRDTLSRA